MFMLFAWIVQFKYFDDPCMDSCRSLWTTAHDFNINKCGEEVIQKLYVPDIPASCQIAIPAGRINRPPAGAWYLGNYTNSRAGEGLCYNN